MPPKPQLPKRRFRFVGYLSKAERKAFREIQEHYHQPTLVSTLRMMIEKSRALIELAPVSDKAE